MPSLTGSISAARRVRSHATRYVLHLPRLSSRKSITSPRFVQVRCTGAVRAEEHERLEARATAFTLRDSSCRLPQGERILTNGRAPTGGLLRAAVLVCPRAATAASKTFDDTQPLHRIACKMG